MKICLWCGKESTDDKDTCPQCGRVIYKEKVAQSPIPEPIPDPDKEAGVKVEVEKVAETPVIPEETVVEKPAEVVAEVAVEVAVEAPAEAPVEPVAEAPVQVLATEQSAPTPPKE